MLEFYYFSECEQRMLANWLTIVIIMNIEPSHVKPFTKTMVTMYGTSFVGPADFEE